MGHIYESGFLGVIDSIWIWLQRIGLILGLLIAIIGLFIKVGGGGTESFVANTAYRTLNCARSNLKRYI